MFTKYFAHIYENIFSNEAYTKNLGEFIIERQTDFPFAKGELSRLLSAIRLAAKVLNSQINKAGLVDDLLGGIGRKMYKVKIRKS